MQNPIIITHDDQFTVDREILITRMKFDRTNWRSPSMVHVLDPSRSLVSRFNRSVDLDHREQHPDLLLKLVSGTYEIEGMVEGDCLTIEWKPVPEPPEPVILDMREIEIDRKRNFTRHNLFLVPVPGAAKDYPQVSRHLQSV